MEERRKVVERKWFTPEEKNFIKSKSNNICSHCGKPLSDNFTVEHVIPISKGGSNDLSNIVALCLDCNNAKDNYIYHPSDYYRYLLPNYMDELVKSQMKYYKEFDWLTPKSVLPEDFRELRISIFINNSGLNSHKKKSVNKLISTKSVVYLKRAVYSDLDDIYNFYCKFTNRVLQCEIDDEVKQSLKKDIINWFENGAIYYIVDKLNSVKVVIPVVFDSYNDNFKGYLGENEKSEGVVPIFRPPLIIKSDLNYAFAAIKAYSYILANISNRLNRDIYFIMSVYDFTRTMHQVFETILSMCDFVFGAIRRIKGLPVHIRTFTGRWSYRDEEMLDNILCLEDIMKYSKRNEDNYETRIRDYNDSDDRCVVSEFISGSFSDLDSYSKSMRVFARNLARQFGFRSKDSRIELDLPNHKPCALVDESVYSVIELPIDEVKLPDSISGDISIPSFVKKQVKLNCVKYLQIDIFNTVIKEDAPILVYLKQIGRKTVKCKIKTKVLEQRKRIKEICSKFDDFSEEDSLFISSLYVSQENDDYTYGLVDVLLSQNCKCGICQRKLGVDNRPFNLLKKPRRYGGKLFDEDNVIVVCKTCRDYVGNLSYSEELKNLILKEYELERQCEIK